MKKTKIKPVETKKRNTYTIEDKAKAKSYYLRDFTIHEISKLINAPVRTIEKWQIAENWKQLKGSTTKHKRILDLYVSGKTYKEIATLLNKSTTTVWRYLTIAKNERANGIK